VTVEDQIHALHLPEAAEPPLRAGEFGPEDWLAFVIFWGLTVIVFLQFFTRYVLNDSFAWTEEAARYFLIALTFIGGGMVGRRRAHIYVEYLHSKLPPALSARLMLLVEVLTCAFFLYAAKVTWSLVGVMGRQRMAVIDLPMGWLYAVVGLGFLVMALREALAVGRRWRALAGARAR
jgi:TRAP-type C4-dicarboxylate transport system permease small subunit